MKTVPMSVFLLMLIIGSGRAEPVGELSVEAEMGNDSAKSVSSQTVSTTESSSEDALRDPFSSNIEKPTYAPPGTVASEGNPDEIVLVLEGLALGQGGAQGAAIINGETYKQGEMRNGIEVIEVRKKEADIRYNQVVRTLRLLPEIQAVKRPAEDAAQLADKAVAESAVPDEKIKNEEPVIQDSATQIIQESVGSALAPSKVSEIKEEA